MFVVGSNNPDVKISEPEIDSFKVYPSTSYLLITKGKSINYTMEKPGRHHLNTTWSKSASPVVKTYEHYVSWYNAVRRARDSCGIFTKK